MTFLSHLPLDPAVAKYAVLPAFIFLARICDVTFGTLRIIFVSRGMRFLAPLMGIFEALIWLLAMSQIMQNLSDVYCYAAYAGGFATGNYVGIWFENRLAMGVATIRIVLQKNDEGVIEHLKEAGCELTATHAEGMSQPVKVLHAIVKRKEIGKVIDPLKSRHPEASYTIEDVRSASPYALQPSA